MVQCADAPCVRVLLYLLRRAGIRTDRRRGARFTRVAALLSVAIGFPMIALLPSASAELSGRSTVPASAAKSAEEFGIGRLYAWGDNAGGQLGLGDKTDRPSATQVGTFSNWQRVAVGPGHSCAVRLDSLWCSGMNNFGQLGLGDNTQRLTMTQVGASTT